MATDCTAAASEGTARTQQLSRRERAFLGQLPDDFLRIGTATAGQPSTAPEGQQTGHRYIIV